MLWQPDDPGPEWRPPAPEWWQDPFVVICLVICAFALALFVGVYLAAPVSLVVSPWTF